MLNWVEESGFGPNRGRLLCQKREKPLAKQTIERCAQMTAVVYGTQIINT